MPHHHEAAAAVASAAAGADDTNEEEEILAGGKRLEDDYGEFSDCRYYEAFSKTLQRTAASCSSCASGLPGGGVLSQILDDGDDSGGRDGLAASVKPLLDDLKKGGKARAVALQKLYRMTDRERQHNRMPMVCTTRFSAIGSLLPCLSREAAAADRRRALLLVANLAVPAENKAAILLNPEVADGLLPALLRAIRGRWNESYLAAACLFNLSYLDDAKPRLLRYVAAQLSGEGGPGDDGDRAAALSYEFYLPEDHPCSLLRILESLVSEYAGFVGSPSPESGAPPTPPASPSASTSTSVQREAVRWSMGALRNLVTNASDNAVLVGTKTRVPCLAAACLEATDRDDLALWFPGSLEDSCLALLAHVAVQPECRPALARMEPNLRRALSRLEGRGGIHEVRAGAILGRVDDEAKQDGGPPPRAEGGACVAKATAAAI